MATKAKQQKTNGQLPVVDRHDEKPIVSGNDTKPFHAVPLGRDICVSSISSYKGKKSLDIRRYYEDENEEWRPTSKGIRLPAESVAEIVGVLFDSFEMIKAELAAE